LQTRESSIVYTNKTSGQEQIYQQRQQYYNAYGQLILDAVYDEQNNDWITQAQCHYDNYGRLIYQTDAAGNIYTYEYDSWDNLINSTDPFNNEYQEEISYSEGDKVVTNSFLAAGSSTPEHVLISYYDLWDQMFRKEDQASGLIELYEYDAVGNIVKHTDPMENETDYEYDNLNQLIKVTDPLNQEIEYSYTRPGNLKDITITEGTNEYTTSWEYDEIGQLKEKSDPAGLSHSLSYNDLGLLAGSTDPNGNNFSYSYDSHNRVTSQSGGGITCQYQYGNHPYGAESISLNNGSTTSYGYDGLGRIQNQTITADAVSRTVSYQYDDAGKITGITGPGGQAVNYSYDRTRLDQVQYDGKNISCEYYPDGLVKSIAYPPLTDNSILKSSYEYDNLNRLTKISNTKGTAVLSEYQYTYDDNSNITTITDASGITTYEYDELNRLASIQRPNEENISYLYDARGNRSTQIGNAVIDTAAATNTYNALNQLTSAAYAEQTTSYSYDPTGMRLTKTNSGVSTRYTYDNGGRIILKEDGAQSTTYIWGGNRLLAKKLAGGAQYYYLYNGHGDVVQITDSAGNIVNSYEYDEWGNITSQTEGIENEFKYAGQTYDSETGLYYLRARYYDPTTGRFISKDSNEGSIVNPLSLNLYTYCVNNPIIFVDPSGNIYTFADPIINNEQQARAVLDFFRPDEIDLAYFQSGGPYGPELVAAGYLVRRAGKLGNLVVKAIKGMGSTTQSMLKAGSKADALKAVDNLPSNVQSNVKSFFKGGSNKYTDFTVEKMSNGNYMAKMTKPGDVPGSKAIYYKEISHNGTTINVFKDTFDPAGNLVHTKPK